MVAGVGALCFPPVRKKKRKHYSYLRVIDLNSLELELHQDYSAQNTLSYYKDYGVVIYYHRSNSLLWRLPVNSPPPKEQVVSENLP